MQSIIIDINLVKKLIATQFPQWNNVDIKPVEHGGWDNRTFHLGNEMLIRLPSAECYAEKVAKEQYWLPKLAPFLPLAIPTPIAMGQPCKEYPWPWSIYKWIKGEAASYATVTDLCKVAKKLAHFLKTLHCIDTTGGLLPGAHNFYRGGLLQVYDKETRQAISLLKGKINTELAKEIWEKALVTKWEYKPVWVHGDISPGNILIENGKLIAVIDFGGLAIGDPACDLAIAWTYFKDKSRATFYEHLPLDYDTWHRGRAWVLWKALILAAGVIDGPEKAKKESWQLIDDLLAEYQEHF